MKHGYKISRLGMAKKHTAEARTHEEAGKLEESLDLFKNARTWLADVRGDEGATLRDEVNASISRLESKLGVEATPPTLRTGVVSAQPEPTDIETFYGSVESRRPIEVELSRSKKGTG